MGQKNEHIADRLDDNTPQHLRSPGKVEDVGELMPGKEKSEVLRGKERKDRVISKSVSYKPLGALGLCKKAGKLVVGFDAVADAIRRGSAKLLVLTGDLSPKSAGRITALALEYKVRHLTTGAAMDDIERLLGKRAGILAVQDQGLAEVVTRQVEEESV